MIRKRITPAILIIVNQKHQIHRYHKINSNNTHQLTALIIKISVQGIETLVVQARLTEVEEVRVKVLIQGDNCHKRCHPTQDNNSFYNFEFVTRSSDNIAQRRAFKHIIFHSRSIVMYTFCSQCDFYLDQQNDYSTTNYDNVVWCSFYWALLSNREIHAQYGQYV